MASLTPCEADGLQIPQAAGLYVQICQNKLTIKMKKKQKKSAL